MPSFEVNTAREVPPSELFVDLPQSFKGFLKRGFEQISQIDDPGVKAIAGALAEGYEPSEDSGLAEILRRLGSEVREKQTFGTALSFLTVFITSREDLPEVISAGETAGIISAGSKERIQRVAQELAKEKDALTEVLKSTALAGAVLPSFQRLGITTELRFKFDESKIERTVPVAVCHLSTDDKESQCFFQLTKNDIVLLIDLLKKTQSQLAAVEAWGSGRA